MIDMVKVRTLRQHDGPEGQKWAGDEYMRTKPEAEHLARFGVVEIMIEGPAQTKGEPTPQNKAERPARTKAKA